MKELKLTIKDSVFSFLIGFFLCQLGAVIATCLTMIFYSFGNSNNENLPIFLNSAIGYMITSLSLYAIMLLLFFFFNKKKNNQITKPINWKKLCLYILIAITSFFTLYPIVICVDSILIKCGIKLSTLSYELTTKNYFISLLSLVIAPAVCEELLFRGLIFKGLIKKGKTFAITITAIMFCIFHMSISQTIYPLLMGLLLSIVMFYEQNIYYCIAIHLTNNFLSLTISYFKLSLIFNHWSYIILAGFLFIAFLSVVICYTIKNNKQHKKEELTKKEIIYLSSSLAFMTIFWCLINFI